MRGTLGHFTYVFAPYKCFYILLDYIILYFYYHYFIIIIIIIIISSF